MKKILNFMLIFSLIALFVFSGNVNAASLDGVKVTTDKDVVHPGTNVTLSIEFGKDLGSYTFDIAYDNSLFEYVSSSDGTANDLDSKVRVVFYDSTGGSNPKSSLSVVFKAKDNITTSNPTNFLVTAEGLANADASEQYDDITTPITTDLTVEPAYSDYQLNLEYDGNIIKNEEKDITISTISQMGRYYDHARLVADVTTETSGKVSIIGMDENQIEYDLIQDGWGDSSGYELGGEVNQVLNFTGLFTESGNYTITLKLIDIENSNETISENSFNITVLDNEISDTTDEENNNNNIINDNNITESTENTLNETVPEELPKTGINYIAIASLLIVASILGYIIIFNKKK